MLYHSPLAVKSETFGEWVNIWNNMSFGCKFEPQEIIRALKGSKFLVQELSNQDN